MKLIGIIGIMIAFVSIAFMFACSSGGSKSFEMKIESNPSGAEVLLDGKKLGITPMTVTIEGLAKNHKIEIIKSGYKSKNTTVFISPGHAANQEYLAETKDDGTWSQVDNNTLIMVLEKD
jgi:hypothetical protein